MSYVIPNRTNALRPVQSARKAFGNVSNVHKSSNVPQTCRKLNFKGDDEISSIKKPASKDLKDLKDSVKKQQKLAKPVPSKVIEKKPMVLEVHEEECEDMHFAGPEDLEPSLDIYCMSQSEACSLTFDDDLSSCLQSSFVELDIDCL